MEVKCLLQFPPPQSVFISSSQCFTSHNDYITYVVDHEGDEQTDLILPCDSWRAVVRLEESCQYEFQHQR